MNVIADGAANFIDSVKLSFTYCEGSAIGNCYSSDEFDQPFGARDKPKHEKLQKRTEEKSAEPISQSKNPKKESDSMWEAATKNAIRATSPKVSREIGQTLLRGILGSR